MGRGDKAVAVGVLGEIQGHSAGFECRGYVGVLHGEGLSQGPDQRCDFGVHLPAFGLGGILCGGGFGHRHGLV